jgi:hypothetical protein
MYCQPASDLSFEIALAQVARHLDIDFGDGSVAGNCDRGAGAGTFDGATNCLADRLCVDDCLCSSRSVGWARRVRLTR